MEYKVDYPLLKEDQLECDECLVYSPGIVAFLRNSSVYLCFNCLGLFRKMLKDAYKEYDAKRMEDKLSERPRD